MRRRLGRPTIRGRIVTLTVIPVIALMALWTFAMVSVTGDLRALIRVQSVYEDFGTPVDTAVGQIQIERRLTAEYLGAGRNDGPATVAALTGQQRSTDKAVGAMRDAIGDRDRRADLTERQRQSLDEMAGAVDGLEDLRGRVLDRAISWEDAVDAYTTLVQPTFDVQSTLTALQAGQLAREGQVVVELVRVREFVSVRTPWSPGRVPPEVSPTASTTRSPPPSRTGGSFTVRTSPTSRTTPGSCSRTSRRARSTAR